MPVPKFGRERKAVETLVSKPEELLGFRGGFFNRALREARLAKGLTQKQLGALVKERIPEFGDQAIGHFETLRTFPNPSVQQVISDILMRPVSELFPPWLVEIRQERAIKEVPLASLQALSRVDIAALEAFNRPTAELNVEETAILRTLGPSLTTVLEGLTGREHRVLVMRFGLDGQGTRTLEEIGHMLGVTRERIRAIEARALRKMRHPSRSRRFKNFLSTDEPLEGSHLFEQQINSARYAIDSAESLLETEQQLSMEHYLREARAYLQNAEKTLREIDPGAWGWGKEKIDRESKRIATLD